MVQHSKVVLMVGSGVVWEWSYTQIESHGPVSAALATAVIASYCSTRSAISTRSIFHPCGTNTPKRTLMPEKIPDLVRSIVPPASRDVVTGNRSTSGAPDRDVHACEN